MRLGVLEREGERGDTERCGERSLDGGCAAGEPERERSRPREGDLDGMANFRDFKEAAGEEL